VTVKWNGDKYGQKILVLARELPTKGEPTTTQQMPVEEKQSSAGGSTKLELSQVGGDSSRPAIKWLWEREPYDERPVRTLPDFVHGTRLAASLNGENGSVHAN
jgi:hypothetical protein